MSTQPPDTNPAVLNPELIMWRLQQLEDGQAEIRSDMLSMRKAQDEILMLLRTQPRCSDPGACVALSDEVAELKKDKEELKTRVRDLEDDRLKAVTSLKTSKAWLVGLYTMAGVGMFKVVASLWEKFSK